MPTKDNKEQKAPRCHIKDMELVESKEDGLFWRCSTCLKTVPHETQAHANANIETTVIEHEFPLSEEELLQVAQQVADADLMEDQLEEEKKVVMAGWNAKVKDAKANKKRFIRLLRDKSEVRSVECSYDYDYKAGTVHFTDISTGEEIFSREMTNDERQMPLFDESQEQ